MAVTKKEILHLDNFIYSNNNILFNHWSDFPMCGKKFSWIFISFFNASFSADYINYIRLFLNKYIYYASFQKKNIFYKYHTGCWKVGNFYIYALRGLANKRNFWYQRIRKGDYLHVFIWLLSVVSYLTFSESFLAVSKINQEKSINVLSIWSKWINNLIKWINLISEKKKMLLNRY